MTPSDTTHQPQRTIRRPDSKSVADAMLDLETPLFELQCMTDILSCLIDGIELDRPAGSELQVTLTQTEIERLTFAALNCHQRAVAVCAQFQTAAEGVRYHD